MVDAAYIASGAGAFDDFRQVHSMYGTTEGPGKLTRLTRSGWRGSVRKHNGCVPADICISQGSRETLGGQKRQENNVKNYKWGSMCNGAGDGAGTPKGYYGVSWTSGAYTLSLARQGGSLG